MMQRPFIGELFSAVFSGISGGECMRLPGGPRFGTSPPTPTKSDKFSKIPDGPQRTKGGAQGPFGRGGGGET